MKQRYESPEVTIELIVTDVIMASGGVVGEDGDYYQDDIYGGGKL